MSVEASAVNVTVSNLALRGATLDLTKCIGCVVENIDLRYPRTTEGRELNPSHSRARFVYSDQWRAAPHRQSDAALHEQPWAECEWYRHKIDNCRVAFTDWMGSLTYVPLGATGNRISIRRCTVSLWECRGRDQDSEYAPRQFDDGSAASSAAHGRPLPGGGLLAHLCGRLGRHGYGGLIYGRLDERG